MKLRMVYCSLVAAWLAVLCGCAQGGKPRQPAAGAIAAPPRDEPGAGLRSANGTYFIVYTTNPNPIPLNEPFSIEAKVYDGQQRSRLLHDVELDVDGRMPHHRHGMNRHPKVTAHGNGGFSIAGMLFHMPGRWELHFDITRQGRTERAQTVVILD